MQASSESGRPRSLCEPPPGSSNFPNQLMAPTPKLLGQQQPPLRDPSFRRSKSGHFDVNESCSAVVLSLSQQPQQQQKGKQQHQQQQQQQVLMQQYQMHYQMHVNPQQTFLGPPLSVSQQQQPQQQLPVLLPEQVPQHSWGQNDGGLLTSEDESKVIASNPSFLKEENLSLLGVIEGQQRSISTLKRRATVAEREAERLRTELDILKDALVECEDHVEKLQEREFDVVESPFTGHMSSPPRLHLPRLKEECTSIGPVTTAQYASLGAVPSPSGAGSSLTSGELPWKESPRPDGSWNQITLQRETSEAHRGPRVSSHVEYDHHWLQDQESEPSSPRGTGGRGPSGRYVCPGDCSSAGNADDLGNEDRLLALIEQQQLILKEIVKHAKNRKSNGSCCSRSCSSSLNRCRNFVNSAGQVLVTAVGTARSLTCRPRRLDSEGCSKRTSISLGYPVWAMGTAGVAAGFSLSAAAFFLYLRSKSR